jgi:hypothetical protein
VALPRFGGQTMKTKLDFDTHAKNIFEFLVRDYGFVQTTMTPDLIRYTSKEVVVDVTYSERHEVDLTIDENPSSYRFQLFLFLKAFYPEVEKTLNKTLNYGIADSDEGVKNVLKQLSDILQQYGKPILQHDKQVFDEMKAFKW